MLVGWLVGNAKVQSTRNWLEKQFMTITAPALPKYSPRPHSNCPCPFALLPLPTRKRLLIGRVSGLISENKEESMANKISNE